MREKLLPWLPAIMCGALSAITIVADIFGRFATGTDNIGLSTFLCFLPICFFQIGVILKNLREENRQLQRRLDEIMQTDEGASKRAA